MDHTGLNGWLRRTWAVQSLGGQSPRYAICQDHLERWPTKINSVPWTGVACGHRAESNRGLGFLFPTRVGVGSIPPLYYNIYRRDRGSRRMRAPQANMSIEIPVVITTRTPSAGMKGMHVRIEAQAQDAYIYNI